MALAAMPHARALSSRAGARHSWFFSIRHPCSSRHCRVRRKSRYFSGLPSFTAFAEATTPRAGGIYSRALSPPLQMPAHRVLIALAAAAMQLLSGCGWEPLYADIEPGAASEELRAIKVDPISERIGQRLEIALRNSLNPTGEPTPVRYRLNTTLSVTLSNLGIQSQGLATLGQLDTYATYRLIDLQTGGILLTNTMHVANSFDLNPNQYSTIVAEDDAGVRSVAELDQEIVKRLTLFIQRRMAEKSPKPA
jgi:LPS-assembly lipoprotein